MKICIIAAKEDENARYLYEEFRKKDFSKVFLADIAKLNIRVSNKKISVYYKNELNWDVYVLRTGAEDPFSYLIANTLEEKAVVSPSSKAILSVGDRGLLAKAIFESRALLQPVTYISSSDEAAKRAAMKFKKIALKFGKHGGKGVAIIDKPSTSSDLLSIFSDIAKPFCVQRFVEGEIIKTLVVGEEVIGIKEYVPAEEERSNEGKKEYIRLKEDVKSALIKLAKHFGTYLFEADLIKDKRKYFLIDVSLNPYLKMYAELSGKNIGAIFADFVLRNYSTIQSSLNFHSDN
jgi:glutathione synthase/RimK-type ligase-like ATP-grasp enzyme